MKTCVNGCNKPICPPSKVLCKDCLDKLGKKIKEICKKIEKETIEDTVDILEIVK